MSKFASQTQVSVASSRAEIEKEITRFGASGFAWEQAKKQKWRALALIVKAKLVAVSDGVATFETEFMPHIVMPDDRTVAEHVMPALHQAFLSGVTPKLLDAATYMGN